ncbi:MAG: sugar phosphate isomerase/epimerase [Pseudomonadota bacterium]
MTIEFSYQLYTSRNFFPLDRVLSMLRDAGIQKVEGFGGLYDDLPGLARALKDFDMTMPSGHINLDTLENDPARAVDIAQTLGIENAYCPYLDASMRPTDSNSWQDFSKRLYGAGEPLREAGIGFGWHNHDFEFVPLADGSLPIDHLLGTEPRLEWEADIAWIIRARSDPLAALDRFGTRMTAVHIKDIARPGEKTDEDGWDDIGAGTIDWALLLDRIAAFATKHVVLEHDNPSDDRRFTERSLAYLNPLTSQAASS